MILFLTRTYFPDGTNGKLTCDGTFISYAIELPWKMNESEVSCIPEGEYFIEKRYSRKFKSHLNVKDVEDRDLILIHPANNALLELDGCIAPVTKLSGPGLGLQSRIAFKKLMDLVSKAIERGEDVLLIVES